MEHRDKPEAYFCNRRKMWICELAETICESTKKEAESRARRLLVAYRQAADLSVWAEAMKEENNCLKNRVMFLEDENGKQEVLIAFYLEGLEKSSEQIKTKDIIIDRLNKRLSDIGGQC